MSYLDVLLGGYKTIQNNGALVAAEPTLNIVGATSIVDDSANKRTTVTLGTGITQLSGDVTAGPGSGSVAATVVKANGASVPAAGSLTTGNVLQVSGASALSYGPVNLAGGSNYISGTLPAGNQAAQTLGGELSGTTGAAVVAGPFSTGTLQWSTGTSAAVFGTQKSGATLSLRSDNNIETAKFDATGVVLGKTAGGDAGLRIAPLIGQETTFSAVWVGANAASPTGSNYAMAVSTTSFIFLSTIFIQTTSAFNDVVIGQSSGRNITFNGGSGTITTNGSGSSLLLGADAAVTMQTLTSTGTEFAKALTIDAQTAPSAPAASKFTIYVDTSDGKLKAIGPSGTITTLAVP